MTDVSWPQHEVLEREIWLRLESPDAVHTRMALAGDRMWAPRDLAGYYEVTGGEGARVIGFAIPEGTMLDYFGESAELETALLQLDRFPTG